MRFITSLFNVSSLTIILALGVLSGCASIPLANYGQDALLKTFPDPRPDKSGVYVFRDTNDSGLLKKRLTLDGEILGDTAMLMYYYRDLEPGTHTMTTQSEFGEHELTFDALASKNMYIRQRITLGVFVASAKLELVDEAEGQRGVLKSYLAQDYVEEDFTPRKGQGMFK
jgi:hypothetical protein